MNGSHIDDSGHPITYLDQYELQRSQSGLSLSDEIRALIIDDPERISANKFVTNRPDVNFWAVYFLDVEGFTYQEMAQRFSQVKTIPWGTISSFYHRAIDYFAPYFRDYFQQ